jgi:3-(3-hydroxy-phenyl)propionate hydroxylase
MPSFLTDSVLNMPDVDTFAGQMVPGAPMDDAPVQVNGQDAWLLDQVGKGFQVMLFADAPPSPEERVLLDAMSASCGSAPLRANAPPVTVTPLIVASSQMSIAGVNVIVDIQGLVAKRYDAKPGTTYLLRPDQHVVARWRTLGTAQIQAALARAIGALIGQA